MANLQKEILGKYNIDIDKENILKLYKIEAADVSPQEVQTLIEKTRRRWNQSINGANEKTAERDKARLAKAEQYEAILLNEELRRGLFDYYSKGDSTKDSNGVPLKDLDFARTFFKLIETSKKIKSDDVEFFFEYYQSERKNKKAIIDMLEKEFKLGGIGKKTKIAEETDNLSSDIPPQEETAKRKGPLIVSLFEKRTILEVSRCVELLEQASQSQDVCQRLPEVKKGLYYFLGVSKASKIEDFKEMLVGFSQKIYAERQERGSDYIPLQTVINKIRNLCENQDVICNFREFTILLRYPNLSPFMYSFVEVKQNTLKGFMEIANKEYLFCDDVDFLINYYKPIRNNFGVTDNGIQAIIKKAEKKAKASQIRDKIDEKLGRQKKRKLSFGAELLHWLTYWPIFVVYFIFEVTKVLFKNMHYLVKPIAALLIVFLNWASASLWEVGNLLTLRYIFSPRKWEHYLEIVSGSVPTTGWQTFCLSVAYIALLALLCVLPAICIAKFLSDASDSLNKTFDWHGYERTYQEIMSNARRRTEKLYFAEPKQFYKKAAVKALINVGCVIAIIAIIIAIPMII